MNISVRHRPRRARLLQAWTALLLAVVLLGAQSTTYALTYQQRMHYTWLGMSYIDDPCTVNGAQPAAAATAASTTEAQANNIKIILGIAKTQNLPKQAGLIALMAGLAESGIQVHTNLQNVPLSANYPGPKQGDGNDHNSVGIFQMQPNAGWSTFATGDAALNSQQAVNQDMDPASSAEIFFGAPLDSTLPDVPNQSALVGVNAAHPRMQRIPGWQTKDPGAVAQQVEVSAFPDSYNKKRAQAQLLLDQYWDAAAPVPLPIPLGAGKAVGGGDFGGSVNCRGTPVVNANCNGPSGSGQILCKAERYAGIWYRFGAGHEAVSTYRRLCPDPTHPTNNKPFGGGGSDNGNPSPCAVDCSSLVSLAVDDAYNQSFMWVVSDITHGDPNWKRISINEAQPGDVATLDSEHIEIVVSADAKTGKVVSFGAHQVNTQVSQVNTTRYYNGFYRYIGPGANSTTP